MSGEGSSVWRILTSGKRAFAATLHVTGDPVRSRRSAPSTGLEVSEGELRAALDGIVRDSLRPLAAGLGALYTVLAVSDGLVLPPAAAAPMMVVTAGTAPLLLGLSLALGCWALPDRWAHPVAAGMAGLLLLNCLLRLFLLSEPQQTTTFMLLAVGFGCVFLSTEWLVLVLAATMGGWGLVVWGATLSSAWLHFGFGLLFIGIFSVLIHTVQVRALRRSEEYFRALTENASDIITILNGDGTVRYVSPSAERVLGYSLTDTLGKEGFAFVHPDDMPGLMSAFAEALHRPGEALSRSEFRLRHHDGSWRTVECVGRNLLDNPAVAGVVVNSRDITERKRAETALRQAYQELERRVGERTAELAEANALLGQEITERQRAAEALRRSEEHFRLLIENALDVIILLNSDGTVRYQSPSAERVLGHKPEEAIGKSGCDFIHPDDLPRVIHVFNEGLQKPGIMPPVEMRVQHRDGSWHVIEVLGNNLLHNPAVEGIIINVRDVTARRHLEDELLKAKERAEAANHAKSEFLATMSHELRTPLSVILGYTDLLLEEDFGSLSDEQAHPLRRIYSNAQELLNLITAVLDVSRLEAGRLPMEVRAVEVPALLEEVKAEVQEMRERSGLAFVWKAGGEIPTIHTDPGKLKVILKNLIGNAVKFTQKGGITVEVQGDPRGVEIKVIDTGRGIPPEALELIFEPFRQVESSLTRSHEGTGLGLYIVKRLLELLGGTVAVESEVGRGSTFRVWVPRESPASPDIPSSALGRTAAARELRPVR